jgi:hypothetical protein
MTMAGFLTKSTRRTSFGLLRKFSGDFFLLFSLFTDSEV